MKTHLSLGTHRLKESVAFYRTLLNAQPVKQYNDYVLFITENPPLELALNRARDPRGTAEHYGVAADSPGIVDEALARLTAAGMHVGVEHEETCCYAKQNKVWATDPDGRRWEVYYVLEETAERDSQSTCCTEDTCNTYAECCGT